MTTEQVQRNVVVADYPGTWKMDPANTTIEFHTKSTWVFPVKGRFGALSGQGTVGDDGSVTGSLTIDATSVDTGNRRRDDHLRSADFFEVETHPSFTFDVSGATLTGPGQAMVDGSLTIKGATGSLHVPVSVRRTGDGVDVQAEVPDLDRREWGLTWAKRGASVHSRLVMHAHFVPA